MIFFNVLASFMPAAWNTVKYLASAKVHCDTALALICIDVLEILA
jgi:hypothetical protein